MVQYNSKHSTNPLRSASVDLSLRFPDKNHFSAWFRVLSAAQSILSAVQYRQRPLPSNSCFALYCLLQKLQRQDELLSDAKTLFTEKAHRLYAALMVHSRKFLDIEAANQTNDNEVLARTLLFALDSTQSSLFCDVYCLEMTYKIDDIVDRSDVRVGGDDKPFEDEEIAAMRKYKMKFVSQIKKQLLVKYVRSQKDFKKRNGFHLKNHYCFLTLLSGPYYVRTLELSEVLCVHVSLCHVPAV